MSRALDQSLKKVLCQSDHTKVYDAVSVALTFQYDDLLDIELLGRSHIFDINSPFLHDGNSLAFTKIGLIQAFLVARQILSKNVANLNDAAIEKVRRATAVMLLMDPEHLTAANTRKRLILLSNQHTENGESDYRQLLLREKYYIDSLLTSRLHRHTKSPVLWDHRRWLLTRLRAHNVPLNLQEEFAKVIFVSGERHPRNYYAWMHARELVRENLATSSSRTGDFFVDGTTRWCFEHHNDVSGWMFLLFLLQKWPGHVDGVMGATLKIVERLKWRNESVWYFVTNLVRGLGKEEEWEPWKEHVVRIARVLTEERAEGSEESKSLETIAKRIE